MKNRLNKSFITNATAVAIIILGTLSEIGFIKSLVFLPYLARLLTG